MVPCDLNAYRLRWTPFNISNLISKKGNKSFWFSPNSGKESEHKPKLGNLASSCSGEVQLGCEHLF